ncbi:MAG: hypothetical protein E7382_01720 [Clostridiales bacterium]|nr:hypothetical protein [Clostridiales bacterium]
MSKRVKISFLSVLAIMCFLMAFLIMPSKAMAEGVTMESQGDKFLLQEESVEKTDKYVYTATVSFERGVAAGLVFGAEDGERYWVFNVDREANLVKLLYFGLNDQNELKPTEFLTDYFIGNDKMTDSEKRLVGNKVRDIEKVQLKVVITPEEDGVYAEFYADNIRRFGIDRVIKLDDFEATYEGGKIGYNCFNSKVTFNDVYFGESDYSYYTELYRNQYHFSQYAHWNNDPNGLVYYDGYYHLYYQHHPFNNYWGDMYWGHARSTDLAHWELLPICLFPDEDWGTGAGYMWSGSAYEYTLGTSTAIDNANWFPNGGGNGIIAFYTRDGGMQDQMIMSSDDGGMTWSKRAIIPQTTATGQDGIYHKVACRDPKVFPIEKSGEKVTAWGMALTGQQENKVWFLKSNDLLNWSYGGEFDAIAPECPDVVNMTADDGNTYTIITLTAREYLVTKMSYDGNLITFTDAKGGEIDASDFQKMDFGPDSYATQTFSISDSVSEYYGKVVSLSWFAGVPATTDSGIYANARKVWNGSGMTIPVIWNLVEEGDGYILTQTPIVKDSQAFTKTEILNLTNKVVEKDGENILDSINTHVFEMSATIDNPNDADISIKINVSDDEYTEIGWTKEEGYFVDRRHTSSAGLNIKDYKFRYTSGPRSSGTQTFYILSDNGGVEVFCDDFKIPFYVLTLASPYSVKAEFAASDTVTVEEMKINQIASTWRTFEAVDGETVLYVSEQDVKMDTVITTEKLLTAFSTAGGDINWQIVEGESVVSFENVTGGIKLKALSSGKATLKVTCGEQEKTIQVNVYGGQPKSDIPFTSDGIISGTWLSDGTGIVASSPAGDGYLLSSASARDFKCSVNFSLEAVAAAFIFRANEDMSEYIIFNYDNNEKIVKMWSPNGEIGRASVSGIDTNNVTLRVEANGDNVKAFINGRLVIDVMLDADEPTEGYFGLNVFSGTATFKSIVKVVDSYTYSNGNLTVAGDSEQPVISLYNKTKNNEKVDKAFFTVAGRYLTINSNYFELLSVGTYVFKAYSHTGSYEFTVEVTAIPQTVLQDTTVQENTNVVIYLGNVELTSLTVNGEQVSKDDYQIKNNVLTLSAKLFTQEYNTVVINDQTLTVTVVEIGSTEIGAQDSGNSNSSLIIWLCVGGVVLIGGVATFLFIRSKKQRRK